MILRKLEVYGFKSFADRQAFNFDKGITAVIGPNGCGKSNVVDAFKWILGEQAPSSIRSKGMADVLHLDREGREAVPYAEGSITFDNETGILNYDAPEVVVTRRIHRDAKSEYLINNQPVRLRQLRDLFMGTGIGTRSYFVLEQGRITEIIKRSPTERRGIFEEAAGIGKYNQRRREAERKLKYVEENLDRARDVVSEITRQIRSLRIQAGKARSYNETAELLREVRIEAGLIRHRKINAELGQLGERLAKIDADELAARNAEETAIKLRENSQHLRQLAGEAVHRYRSTLADNEERVREWREKIGVERERAQSFREEAEQKLGDRERLASDVAERRDELQALEVALTAAAGARDVFGALRHEKLDELAAVEERLEQLEAEAHALRDQSLVAERERAALATEVGELRVKQGNLEGGLERLTSRASSLVAKITALAAQRKAVAERTDELSNSLAATKADLESRQQARDAARERVAELDREIAERRVDQKERQGRLAILRDLESAREGLGEGARFLLDNAEQSDGAVRGLLGDIFDVEPDYARAIERALGENVEALLTDDMDGALTAADELREAGKGGAIFWPLDGAGDQAATLARPEALPSGEGVIGWAPDLIRPATPADGDEAAPVDPRQVGAALLLRDVVLVTGREDALRVQRAGVDPTLRLVTLDGEIFGPARRVVAGERQSGGLISRRLEVQRLEEAMAELDAALTRLTAQRNEAAQTLATTEASVVQAEEQVRSRDIDRVKHSQEIEELARQAVALEEERAVSETEVAEMSAELESLKGREATVAENLTAREGEVERFANEAERIRVDRERRARDVAATRAEVDRVEGACLECARRENERRAMKEQIAARLTEIEQLHGRLEGEAENLRHWAERNDAEILGLEQRIDETDAARERWSSLLKLAESELENFTETLEAALRDEESARASLEGVRRSREDDRVREGQLRTRLEGLIDRLREEEGVDLVALAEAAPLVEEARAADEAAAASSDGSDSDEPAAESDAGERDAGETGTGETGTGETGESSNSVAVNGVAHADGSETEAEEAAPPAPKPEPVRVRTLSELDEEASRLKRKLDRLGPVNAEAIRELEALEQREAFYLGQEKDLLESQEALEDIIRRINKRSRQIFLDTFNKVRGEFQQIFRKLFGGGRGDIRLLDEDNVLESGVEIVAQPPEKGAKSIDMLSGGEQVMTTTGLLFAIFRARPCPFCLLDEIDAALDEANIMRFLDMVKGFVGKTQFIVVTHNRKTIAEADVIHGITMPKAGRSTRVSVKFENGEVRAVGNGVQPAFALD